MAYFINHDLKIYYEIVGKGVPLFLINGLGCDARSWEPLIKLLKPHFTVISYDMRCAGKSDKPIKPFTIQELTDEALSLLRHLGINKTNLLGFSMGGMIAMNLAITKPELIDKLFLISTAPSLKQPFPISEEAMTLLHQTEISDKLLKDVYKLTFGPDYRKRNSAEGFIKFRMTDNNPQPAEAYLNQLESCKNIDLSKQISKIEKPTTIIAGDSDQLIPSENFKWLHEQITNSKTITLSNIGHMIPIEAPEQLSKILISR